MIDINNLPSWFFVNSVFNNLLHPYDIQKKINDLFDIVSTINKSIDETNNRTEEFNRSVKTDEILKYGYDRISDNYKPYEPIMVFGRYNPWVFNNIIMPFIVKSVTSETRICNGTESFRDKYYSLFDSDETAIDYGIVSDKEFDQGDDYPMMLFSCQNGHIEGPLRGQHNSPVKSFNRVKNVPTYSKIPLKRNEISGGTTVDLSNSEIINNYWLDFHKNDGYGSPDSFKVREFDGKFISLRDNTNIWGGRSNSFTKDESYMSVLTDENGTTRQFLELFSQRYFDGQFNNFYIDNVKLCKIVTSWKRGIDPSGPDAGDDVSLPEGCVGVSHEVTIKEKPFNIPSSSTYINKSWKDGTYKKLIQSTESIEYKINESENYDGIDYATKYGSFSVGNKHYVTKTFGAGSSRLIPHKLNNTTYAAIAVIEDSSIVVLDNNLTVDEKFLRLICRSKGNDSYNMMLPYVDSDGSVYSLKWNDNTPTSQDDYLFSNYQNTIFRYMKSKSDKTVIRTMFYNNPLTTTNNNNTPYCSKEVDLGKDIYSYKSSYNPDSMSTNGGYTGQTGESAILDTSGILSTDLITQCYNCGYGKPEVINGVTKYQIYGVYKVINNIPYNDWEDSATNYTDISGFELTYEYAPMTLYFIAKMIYCVPKVLSLHTEATSLVPRTTNFDMSKYFPEPCDIRFFTDFNNNMMTEVNFHQQVTPVQGLEGRTYIFFVVHNHIHVMVSKKDDHNYYTKAVEIPIKNMTGLHSTKVLSDYNNMTYRRIQIVEDKVHKRIIFTADSPYKFIIENIDMVDEMELECRAEIISYTNLNENYRVFQPREDILYFPVIHGNGLIENLSTSNIEHNVKIDEPGADLKFLNTSPYVNGITYISESKGTRLFRTVNSEFEYLKSYKFAVAIKYYCVKDGMMIVEAIPTSDNTSYKSKLHTPIYRYGTYDGEYWYPLGKDVKKSYADPFSQEFFSFDDGIGYSLIYDSQDSAEFCDEDDSEPLIGGDTILLGFRSKALFDPCNETPIFIKDGKKFDPSENSRFEIPMITTAYNPTIGKYPFANKPLHLSYATDANYIPYPIMSSFSYPVGENSPERIEYFSLDLVLLNKLEAPVYPFAFTAETLMCSQTETNVRFNTNLNIFVPTDLIDYYVRHKDILFKKTHNRQTLNINIYDIRRLKKFPKSEVIKPNELLLPEISVIEPEDPAKHDKFFPVYDRNSYSIRLSFEEERTKVIQIYPVFEELMESNTSSIKNKANEFLNSAQILEKMNIKIVDNVNEYIYEGDVMVNCDRLAGANNVIPVSVKKYQPSPNSNSTGLNVYLTVYEGSLHDQYCPKVANGQVVPFFITIVRELTGSIVDNNIEGAEWDMFISIDNGGSGVKYNIHTIPEIDEESLNTIFYFGTGRVDVKNLLTASAGISNYVNAEYNNVKHDVGQGKVYLYGCMCNSDGDENTQIKLKTYEMSSNDYYIEMGENVKKSDSKDALGPNTTIAPPIQTADNVKIITEFDSVKLELGTKEAVRCNILFEPPIVSDDEYTVTFTNIGNPGDIRYNKDASRIELVNPVTTPNGLMTIVYEKDGKRTSKNINIEIDSYPFEVVERKGVETISVKFDGAEDKSVYYLYNTKCVITNEEKFRIKSDGNGVNRTNGLPLNSCRLNITVGPDDATDKRFEVVIPDNLKNCFSYNTNTSIFSINGTTDADGNDIGFDEIPFTVRCLDNSNVYDTFVIRRRRVITGSEIVMFHVDSTPSTSQCNGYVNFPASKNTAIFPNYPINIVNIDGNPDGGGLAYLYVDHYDDSQHSASNTTDYIDNIVCQSEINVGKSVAFNYSPSTNPGHSRGRRHYDNKNVVREGFGYIKPLKVLYFNDNNNDTGTTNTKKFGEAKNNYKGGVDAFNERFGSSTNKTTYGNLRNSWRTFTDVDGKNGKTVYNVKWLNYGCNTTIRSTHCIDASITGQSFLLSSCPLDDIRTVSKSTSPGYVGYEDYKPTAGLNGKVTGIYRYKRGTNNNPTEVTFSDHLDSDSLTAFRNLGIYINTRFYIRNCTNEKSGGYYMTSVWGDWWQLRTLNAVGFGIGHNGVIYYVANIRTLSEDSGYKEVLFAITSKSADTVSNNSDSNLIAVHRNL